MLDILGIFCYNITVFYRSSNDRNCSPRFNKNPRFLIKHFQPVVEMQPVLFLSILRKVPDPPPPAAI